MKSHKSNLTDPLSFPRFSGITTFSRLPFINNPKKAKLDVGILGIPSDAGTTYRSGARFGPRAIREASVLCRNYNPELQIDVYKKLNVADLGDVQINPLNLKKTLQSIEKKTLEIINQKINLLSLGGDHSILLPILRAHKKKYKKLTVIQFDAHTDTADQAWGESYHHGTPIRRAIEEKLIQGKNVFQIGIRGPLTSQSQDDFVIKNKINILDMAGFHNKSAKEAFFKLLKNTAGKDPVYITFDVDGVDPAFTPGTGTPVVGGLTSFEALSTLKSFDGLNVIGGDVVEVAPAYDHAEITSLFASAVIFEILSLIAKAK